MIQLDGRLLPPENIMFKNSSQTAGPEADWGRHATKETVISAVSSRGVATSVGVGPNLSLHC